MVPRGYGEQHAKIFGEVGESFRPLTAGERSSIQEWRLRVREARAGETLEALSRRTGNRWSVEAVSPRRRVVRSHATLELAWWAVPMVPLLRLGLRGPMRQLAEELRYRVENGRPHPRVTAP